jgi:hypothetical protein
MIRQAALQSLVVSLVLAALLPAPLAAAPRLETVLGGDMDLLVLIEDAAAMRAGWAASPWGDMWRDPAFGPVADSVRVALNKSLGENGETRLGEILDLLHGQVALSLNIEPPEMGGAPTLSWALLAGFQDEAGLETLRSVIDGIRGEGTLDEDTETVDGVSVRTRLGESGEQETWAYADGIGIVGHPAAAVKNLVAAVAGKGTGPRLAATTGYMSMTKEAPKADVSFLIHFANLSRLVTRLMERGMENNPNTGMMGLTPEGMSRALALDAIDALYMTWDDEETESVLHSGVLYHGTDGILGLMSYLPGPCLRPQFIPQTAVMASTTRMSIPVMYTGLMNMLQALNPGIAMMAKAQLQQLTMSYGLDLEKDLLDNLGENSFWAYLPAPDSGPTPDQVFGIEVKDPDAINNALTAIKTTMGATGEPEPVDRVGDTAIYSLSAPEAEGSVYYALNGKYLFICRGSSESLAAILRGVGKPGPSIWDRKDLKPYFDRLPKNPSGLTYYDLGSLFRMTATAVEEKQQRSSEFPDMSIVSRYFGALVGGEYKTDAGMQGVAYVPHLKR